MRMGLSDSDSTATASPGRRAPTGMSLVPPEGWSISEAVAPPRGPPDGFFDDRPLLEELMNFEIEIV